MQNKLYVGFSRNVELPKGGFLFIDDEIPKLSGARRPRIFDPNIHSINFLKGLDYRTACDIVAALQAAFPAGENTLTKEGVPGILLEALLNKPKGWEKLLPEKSKDPSYLSAQRMVERVLRSPVLNKVLTGKRYFSFNRNSANLCRINRAELGEFDALVLGLLIVSQFHDQLVIPDFGFYGREAHSSLIREGRLIAGVNTLAELTPKLRQSALLIKDKVGQGATFEDAELLAKYAGHRPDPLREANDYDRFIREAMG